MTCIRIPLGIICVNPWGRVKLGNRYILIDFHEYCGPSFSYVKGNEYYDPVDENDPIWPLFYEWHRKYEAKKARQARAYAKENNAKSGNSGHRTTEGI